MSLEDHVCTMGFGSYSMLPPAVDLYQLVGRNIYKLFLVSEHHPHIFKHFRSHPAVVAERQLQLREGSKLVIHPYSLLRLFWSSVMILINLLHNIMSTLRLCYVLPSDQTPVLEFDKAFLVLQWLCLFDIFVNFNTGYVSEDTYSYVVMDRSRIASRYLHRWFFLDLLTSLPIAIILLYFNIQDQRYILVAHMLPTLRIIKLGNVTENLDAFMKIFTNSYVWYRCVRHATLFIVTIHWCNCLVYFMPVFIYYWTGTFPIGFNKFLPASDGNLKELPLELRYMRAVFVSLSAFFGTGIPMFRTKYPSEIIVHSLIILYAAIFMVYTVVLVLKLYMTKYNSAMRYHELMNQVENYICHKQFPAPLKKRVREFYTYHYQERYYKEDTVLECLSDQLRSEINLHTCHKLVNKVALFGGMPHNVVGAIIASLRSEVYLPNDLVVRAGDCGDCMYFIANGTVAVYSLKGIEVCHLEDGAHFGEVALLMKDSKRVATVVAVEITQLYRLDAADFRKLIVGNQELYNRIGALAAQRMHETVLLDEVFRKERGKQNEQFQASMHDTSTEEISTQP